MNKPLVFLIVAAIVGTGLFAVVATLTHHEPLFDLEVNDYQGQWYYSVWYKRGGTLTDVHIIVDGNEVRVFSALSASEGKSVFHWTTSFRMSITVDIRWNGGQESYSFS